jgi:pSer/pThr/pTyr-binding forkhead associated (FHA) protein
VASDDAWLVAGGGGGLAQGERYDLFGGLTIGRSQDADVQISDRYASGLHCRVFNRGDTYFVEDMRSTNGTLLNDQPVDTEVRLADGDVIRIGDTELRFEGP